MRLGDLDLTLGQLELGQIDAEADARLSDYFVTTDYAREAASGRGSLFLGRKGSGKSALFTQLPRLLKEAGNNSLFVSLTPDQYAWAALKGYAEQGLLAEQAHTNAWRLTLTLEAASALASASVHWEGDAARDIEAIAKFLADNFGRDYRDAGPRALGILKDLRGVNLSAFGFWTRHRPNHA